MPYYNSNTLAELPQRYRASLINSLVGVRPAMLLGTINVAGQDNLAIFNSVLHVGANPALLGLLFRPHSVERHSLENIKATGVFSLSSVSATTYEKAHQTSARYPREISEFDGCGIARAFFEEFPAPYVKDSAIAIGLKLVEQITIASNETILLIGAYEHLHIGENVIMTDGTVRADIAQTVGCGGLDTYYAFDYLAQLPYAKYQ